MYTASHRKHFSQVIRKKIILISALIMAVIALLTTILFFMYRDGRDEAALVDIFGKQRMLTQQIAKQTNIKYTMLLALQTGPLVESPDGIRNIITQINTAILSAQKDFNLTLESLYSGELQYSGKVIRFGSLLGKMDALIKETQEQWGFFSQSADVITQSNTVNTSAAQALIYINGHNEKLLQYCDDIVKGLIDNQRQELGKSLTIAIACFIVVCSLLTYAIYHLQKHIIEPLDNLFRGVESLAMLKTGRRIPPPAQKELAVVVQDINEGFDQLQRVIDLIVNINENMSFEEVLGYIYTSFAPYIPYSHIGVALLKEDGKTLEASYGVSAPHLKDLPKKLVGIRAQIENTSLVSVVKHGEPRVIGDLQKHVKNPSSDYNRIIMQAGIQSSITLPLQVSGKPMGAIFFSSLTRNAYNEKHMEFLEVIASSIAISFNKNIFIDELLYSTVLALAKMVESKDEETGDHLGRMKQYSKLFTQFLIRDGIYTDQLTIGLLKDIEQFSPMHDIGKVGIRDSILQKPDKLAPDEFEEMKQHTVYGGQVLRTAESHIQKFQRSIFSVGIQIAEGHHEKWDGSGYPRGRKGEKIPLCARIVAAADVFDALTSRRPYKPAFSFEQSIDILVEGRGKQFDPLIIDAILNHLNELKEMYEGFSEEIEIAAR